MLRNKIVVSLILVATFLVLVSPLFMAIYAQAQNPEQQIVREQKFMEAAIQARERAYELKDLVIEKIGNIPDEIEDLLNEADILLAEGNIQKAIEAMNKYRNAYSLLYCYLEQHGVDIETPETARGIMVAIIRTYARIEKLNNTINLISSTLDKTDSNYDQVKAYLEWGWGNLTEATDNINLANYSLNIEPPNIIWATNNLTESNRNIQEAYKALELIACWTNQWRIRNFLGEQNRTRERIRERIQQGGFDLGAILEKLGYASLEDFEQAIDGLVENAQQRMEIREAVQELWTIREKLREMNQELQNKQHGLGV